MQKSWGSLQAPSARLGRTTIKDFIINLGREIDDDEERLICFATEDILNYSVVGQKVHIFISDNASEALVREAVLKVLGSRTTKIQRLKTDGSYASNNLNKNYYCPKVFSDIIYSYGQGQVTLGELGIKLYNYFDKQFVALLNGLNVQFCKYPTLLPIETLSQTKYLSSSPQYVHFCSPLAESISVYEQIQERYNHGTLNEDLQYPKLTLSPSACFHLFGDIRDKEFSSPQIISMRQNVFRNEGRHNWGDICRLRDYNVREIVFIGSRDYVIQTRKVILARTVGLLKKLGLNFKINIASDPFVLPDMQKYKKIQEMSAVKYELQVNIDEQRTTACASYNLHGTSFSSRFNFKVKDADITESGCIGFGLERFIVAFLCQFGGDTNQWPEYLREEVK